MSSISCTVRQTEKVEIGVRRAQGGSREGDARVVAHEPLDGLAAAQEARHLPQPHPGQRHRHDGLVLPPRAGADGQPREGGDGRPPTQELEPHVPAAGQLTPQGVAGQEALERGLVTPLREDREPPDLQPVRGHRGSTEPHQGQALGVVEPGRRGGRRAEERPHAHPAGHLGEVEGVESRDPLELVVQADRRRRPEPQLVVGPQHPVRVDVHVEGLVQRDARGVGATVADDDVRPVLAEPAGR